MLMSLRFSVDIDTEDCQDGLQQPLLGFLKNKFLAFGRSFLQLPAIAELDGLTSGVLRIGRFAGAACDLFQLLQRVIYIRLGAGLIQRLR